MINAILLMAGDSSRFNKNKNSNINKNLYKFKDKEAFLYPLFSLTHNKNIFNIVIVTKENEIDLVKNIIKSNSSFLNKDNKLIHVIKGGLSRQESTFKALTYIRYNIHANENDLVLIHDAARIFLFNESIENSIKEFSLDKSLEATSLIKDSRDSLILDDGMIKYLNRDLIKIVLTPQVFKLEKIYKAHLNVNKLFTDDLSILLSYFINSNIKLIKDPNINIKLTLNEDLELINLLLNNDDFIRKLTNFDYNI